MSLWDGFCLGMAVTLIGISFMFTTPVMVNDRRWIDFTVCTAVFGGGIVLVWLFVRYLFWGFA